MPPSQIGPYLIISPIAQGGMGAVYRARDASGREVALKVLLPHLSNDADFVKRFSREVQALSQLRHPNIVQIFDAGQADGHHYMAMEYLPGGNLLVLLKNARKAGQVLPVRTALEITRQIALALEQAHNLRVVHRDIKPSNIMLAGTDRYVLTDFGVVRGDQMTQVTQTFAAVGTPDYMSPEQSMGRPVDGRSDLYALGVVLYEMLAGRVPFVAENTPALLYKHVHENPPDVRALRSDVPDGVRALVEKLLAKKPDQRYQTAGQLAADIARLLAKQSPKLVVKPGFPKALAALMGVAAFAGLGFGAFRLATDGQDRNVTLTATAASAPTQETPVTAAVRASVTSLPIADAAKPTQAVATATIGSVNTPAPTATSAPAATAAPPTRTPIWPSATLSPTPSPTPKTPTDTPVAYVTPSLKLTLIVPIKTFIFVLPTATPTPFKLIVVRPVATLKPFLILLPTATP